MLKIFDESVNAIVTFSRCVIRGGDVDSCEDLYRKVLSTVPTHYRTRWIDNNSAVPRDSIFRRTWNGPYIYIVYNERTWPSLSGTVYIYSKCCVWIVVSPGIFLCSMCEYDSLESWCMCRTLKELQLDTLCD